MKIALAQIDPTIAHVAANAAKVRRRIDEARELGADLVAFSEMTLVGYPPRDLLESADLVEANLDAVETIAAECTDIAALVGFVRPATEGAGPPLEDAVALLDGGRIRQVHVKSLLPNYSCYDDPRYFRAGPGPQLAVVAGEPLGVMVCEDLWDSQALGRTLYDFDPMVRVMESGVDRIVNIAASGFQDGKVGVREDLFARQARRSGALLLYTNQVGGKDEMVFDGGSCAVAADGTVVARAKSFREDLLIIDVERPRDSRVEPLAAAHERLEEALRVGMADFLRGSECDRAVVELDGGANSAVLAALAREALGPECLVAACPRERGGESSALARSICSHLGLHEVPLDTPPSDEPALARRTREARLSDLADREGWMVFCDADKTALALGACLPVTARRALAPLGDVFSTSLKATARRMIRCGRLPAAVASALEPEDKRSESRERILELSIESGWTPGQIVAAGYDAEEVAGTLRRANGAESIRRRMPIVLQVSARSFGPGRRMPIACRPPGL